MKMIMLGVLLAGFAGGTAAGDLDQLLHQVQDARVRESRIDEERKSRFLADKTEQQKLLNETRAALARAEADNAALRAQFSANEERLAALNAELKQHTGALGELFGSVREFAGTLKADLDHSLISAQFGGRTAALERLVKSPQLPTIAQLENLWLHVLKEMTESGKAVRFHGKVTGSAGAERETEIVRIGAFSALADGAYLRYLPETGQLMELPRQPAREFRTLAEDLLRGPGDDRVTVAIDPTRGVVLDLAMQVPDVWQRVNQGGVIGYLIIALGIAGGIMVLTRLVLLHGTGKKMQEQLANLQDCRPDNPLGRVLAAAGACPTDKVEQLELHLDQAVLRELPVLERGHSLLKLLIAVAPLLGLLGTVTGMIQVFQSITQYGSGDPRLMAGGIAEALVTTMLGLEVAIPLSFLYSLLAVRSRSLIQILDEQSAGLLSKSLERSRA